ncbi:calcium/sodium antiporter [Onishia taeanensis]
MELILFAAGLALMLVGAELLVRGAARLAAAFGIPPVLIGLTVVAFGTSAPELAVSVEAAWAGQAEIAVGNVVGSNIFNVLFILGVTALIVPLSVSRRLARMDVPLMIALSVVVLLLSLDGHLSHAEGGLLLAALVAYVGYAFYHSRRDRAAVSEEYAGASRQGGAGGWITHALLVVGGLALLVVGSGWFVDGAVSFAQYLGISDLVIGLTVVAAGTSLPEVVTSVIAAVRGERDIAVANVVGSNLFNIMGVLGVTGLVAPQGVEISSAVLAFDMPVMIAAAFACLPVVLTGAAISRWEGGVLLAYYGAYTLYLVLVATQHAALLPFSGLMLYVILPLTVVVFLGMALRERRRSGRNPTDT